MPPRTSIVRELEIHVRSGALAPEVPHAEEGEWVYAWLRPGPRPDVIYVGATGLSPVERTRLHLTSPDPGIGRIRAAHPQALEGEVVVRAFELMPVLERQVVKRLLLARMGGDASTARVPPDLEATVAHILAALSPAAPSA